MQPSRELVGDRTSDRLAYRLAGPLSHPRAVAHHHHARPRLQPEPRPPSPGIARSARRRGLALRRVPQSPLVVNAACASALSALGRRGAAAAPLVSRLRAADVLLWTAADAGLEPDARILEGFGPGGLMSMPKLDAINRDRRPARGGRRPTAWRPSTSTRRARWSATPARASSSPRSSSPCATGSTSRRSSSAGVRAARRAARRTSPGSASGARTRSSTRCAWPTTATATTWPTSTTTWPMPPAPTRTRGPTSPLPTRRGGAAAEAQGYQGRLPLMRVGAPRPSATATPWARPGLKAVAEAIHYVLGQPAVGVPTLRAHRQGDRPGHRALPPLRQALRRQPRRRRARGHAGLRRLQRGDHPAVGHP